MLLYLWVSFVFFRTSGTGSRPFISSRGKKPFMTTRRIEPLTTGGVAFLKISYVYDITQRRVHRIHDAEQAFPLIQFSNARTKLYSCARSTVIRLWVIFIPSSKDSLGMTMISPFWGIINGDAKFNPTGRSKYRVPSAPPLIVKPWPSV